MTYKKHFFKGPSRFVVAPRLATALRLQRFRSNTTYALSIRVSSVVFDQKG